MGSLGSLDKDWVEEYLDGYRQEVYLVELSKAFVGKLFCVAANICFKYAPAGQMSRRECVAHALLVAVTSEFNVCLFGVETRATFGPPTAEEESAESSAPSDADGSDSDDSGDSMPSFGNTHNPMRARKVGRLSCPASTAA